MTDKTRHAGSPNIMRLERPRSWVSFASQAALACFCCSQVAFAQDSPDSVKQAIDEAVAKVKPALVRIHVVSTHYGGGREMKSESTGSGAIITEDGCVITNHHVAGHATRLTCTLSNKEEVTAEPVGTDPLSDISVIRLKIGTDGI